MIRTRPALFLALASANALRSQAMFAAIRSSASASISGVRPRLLLLPTICMVMNDTLFTVQARFSRNFENFGSLAWLSTGMVRFPRLTPCG